MNIGVCALLVYDAKILALECSKGRGIILPGGRYEESDGDFLKTALRELKEETGVTSTYGELLFHSMAPDGFYDYCYIVDVPERFGRTIDNFIDLGSGQPKLVNKLDSKVFNPYYAEMFRQLAKEDSIRRRFQISLSVLANNIPQ